MVFQWIQNLIVDAVSSGVLSIPPPLLTRTFQDLGSGMSRFHDALKYARVPFPFPYIASTDLLLIIHWVVTPIVICSWTSQVVWAAFFTFMLVFVLWTLHLVANELENPFGGDMNDLNMADIQDGVNMGLLLLISKESRETPRLCVDAGIASARLTTRMTRPSVSKSFDAIMEKSVHLRRNTGKTAAKMSTCSTFSKVHPRSLSGSSSSEDGSFHAPNVQAATRGSAARTPGSARSSRSSRGCTDEPAGNDGDLVGQNSGHTMDELESGPVLFAYSSCEHHLPSSLEWNDRECEQIPMTPSEPSVASARLPADPMDRPWGILRKL